MLRRLHRAAATLIPPVGLIVLLIIGNAFARVFLTPTIAYRIRDAVAVCFSIALLLKSGKRNPPSVMLPLGILWGGALITSAFAHNREYALVETTLWLVVLMTFWMASFLEPQRVERIVFAVLAAYAALALLQAGWSLLQPGGLSEVPRPPAMTPNPNNLGAAMLPAIALALWRRRWFWLAIFVLALLLSGARAALGGLLVGVAVMGVWMVNRRVSIPRPIWLMVGVVALLFAPVLILQVQHGTHGTLALRLDIWRSALLTFRDDPITGIGPQNFEYGFLQYKTMDHVPPVHQHAHGIVQEVAATMGLLGLAALAFLGYALVRDTITIYKAGDQPRAAIAGALLASLIAQGLLEYVYWVVSSTLIVMLAGWALAHTPEAVPHTPTRRETIGVAAVWIIGIILIFALPLTTWQPTLLGLGLAFGFFLTLRGQYS